MTDTKAQMLRSLAIDRSGTAENPFPSSGSNSGPESGFKLRSMRGSAALLGIAVVGAALWYFVPRASEQSQQADTAQAKSAPAPAPAIAAEPRRAGSLVASGYVVARRKATVAAE